VAIDAEQLAENGTWHSGCIDEGIPPNVAAHRRNAMTRTTIDQFTTLSAAAAIAFLSTSLLFALATVPAAVV
jgi:hypothetical protein